MLTSHGLLLGLACGVVLLGVSNFGTHSRTCQLNLGDFLNTFQVRLREERERLGLTQTAFGEIGGVLKQAQIKYEKGERCPDSTYLSAIALAGADVQYVLTGNRRGEGLGQSAVHQAVLDAVELLSLEKKLDPQQLAKAVVKLCAKQQAATPEPSPAISNNGGVVMGNVSGGNQTINAPVYGVVGRDIVVNSIRGKDK